MKTRNTDVFTVVSSIIEDLKKEIDQKITDIEMEKFVRPFGIEFIFSHLEKVNWWVINTPDNPKDACGYQKIEWGMIVLEEFDEPIKCGKDSISKYKKIETVYKPCIPMKLVKKNKSSRIRIK